MDWFKCRVNKLATSEPSRSISIHRILQRSRSHKSDHNSKRNSHRINNRHNFGIPAIGAVLFGLLSPSAVLSETVGGVSATANPIANSSGSVTNQAIQVLQGPYITNTYGGGIQCQGPTVNFTPYVTGNVSKQKPWEPYYNDPVYDVTDNFGAFDDAGKEIGDGILDNPGDILFYKRTRTGQKDNYNLSVGFSATWSSPLDRKLQNQCKEAAATQIKLQQQLTANKRLDFELARLKTCGNLLKEGIMFTPGTEMSKLCADVTVLNKNAIAPHRHSIPSASLSATGVSEK